MTSRIYLALGAGLFVMSCSHSDAGRIPEGPEKHRYPEKQPEASRTSEKQLHLVLANGEAARGVAVVVTDIETGKELAVGFADDQGVISVPQTGASLALSANDPEHLQSIFVSKVADETRVALNSDCQILQGHISGVNGPPGGIVRAVRFSRDIGDRFAAHLDTSNSFRFCVPKANYRIEIPKEFTRRIVFAHVPLAAPLTIPTSAVESSQVSGRLGEGLTSQTRAQFVSSLSTSVTVVGLGESNHGASSYVTERIDLMLELAKNKGYRLGIMEFGYGESLAIDDYVVNGTGDLPTAVRKLDYWIWDTKDFIEAMERIREYNKSLPKDKRIHILGFDVQNTQGSAAYILKAAASLLTTKERSTLEPLTLDGAERKPPETDARTTLDNILDRLARLKAGREIDSQETRISLAAKSLQAWMRFSSESDFLQRIAVRDELMATLAVDCVNAVKLQRATLWAHVAHLSRSYAVGGTTMGQFLGRQLGSQYQVFAFLAGGGQARAWDPLAKIGVIPNTIPPPAKGSLEEAFSLTLPKEAVTYWRFSDAKGDAQRWLSARHSLRVFGAQWEGDEESLVPWDIKDLDGAVYFQTVQPSVPTPTGERRVPSKQ